MAPSSKGFLLREDQWAYLQYAEDASRGIELFGVAAGPQQNTNLADQSQCAAVVAAFQAKLADKLREVRHNDLSGGGGRAAPDRGK